ncbi:MAG: O-antigen ligase family protein [Burkholderiales bacterium]|nr:O-antigen ligase family protein [Burkholderiales bacterium]
MENKFNLYYVKLISYLLTLFPLLVFFTQQDLTDYTLGILALAFIVEFVVDKKNKIEVLARQHYIFFGITVGFFAWHMLSVVIHGKGNWYHGYYFRLLLIVPLFYLLAKRQLMLENINKSLILTVIFSFLVGIYQHFILKYPRAGVPFVLNQGYYPINWGDTILLISVYLGAYAALYKPRQPNFYWLGVILGITCLFLSGSRGGLIGLPFIGLICLFQSNATLSRKFTLIIIAVLSCCLALFIAYKFNLFRIADAYNDLYTCYYQHQCLSYSNGGDNSLGLRFEMWYNAWALFKQSPMTGSGIGGYTQAIIDLANQGKISNYFATRYNEEPHNEILRMLAMLGVPGIILYILILGYPIFMVNKNKEVLLLMSSVMVLFFCESLSQAVMVAPIPCDLLIYLIAVVFYIAVVKKSSMMVK